MIGRIGHLLAGGVGPEKIMVLMFNRSARDAFESSMRQRLGARFGDALPEIRTFHSLGHRLVQSFSRRGVLPDFALVTEDHILERLARQVATEAYRHEHETGWPPAEDIEEFLNFIDLVKSGTATPQKVFKRLALDAKFSYFVAGFTLFEQARTQRKIRFYADLIWEPVVALERDSELVGWVGNRVEHIIVDEYQDINEVQQTLLSYIAGDRAQVMVVGDVDQCIYEWRGAQPDFITHRFARDFPKPTEYLLSRTFRFGHSLSLAADYLIVGNNRRDDKLCISHESTPGTSLVRREERGTHPIVAELQQWQKKGRSLQEAVVLVRLYAQSIPVELALLEADIPYRIDGNNGVFECSEVVALLGYLAFGQGCLANFSAAERTRYFQAMLSQPHLGVQREELARLAEELAVSPGSEIAVLRLHLQDELPPFIRKRLEETIDNWQWLTDCNKRLQASVLLERLVSRLGLYDFYYSLAARAAGAENRVKTCRAFIDFAGQRQESVAVFLARIEELKSKSGEQSGARLLITSVHRAKGLEWPKVFLPGLADGMFPFVRENGDRTVELEDERRLFYVAMTRAIEEVVFCHPPDPRLEKHLEAGNCALPQGKLQASRFLFETNLMLVDRLGREIQQGRKKLSDCSAVHAETGNRYLAMLGLQGRIQSLQAEPEPVARVLSINELSEGMPVFHPTFGVGTVSSIDDRRQGRLRVDFAGQGETVLLAAYARLQSVA